jgi:hypothetical protein
LLGERVYARREGSKLLGKCVHACREGIDPRVSTRLRLDELADEGGELEELVAEDVATQLGAPLGVLVEQADEVLEVVDREGH